MRAKIKSGTRVKLLKHNEAHTVLMRHLIMMLGLLPWQTGNVSLLLFICLH